MLVDENDDEEANDGTEARDPAGEVPCTGGEERVELTPGRFGICGRVARIWLKPGLTIMRRERTPKCTAVQL